MMAAGIYGSGKQQKARDKCEGGMMKSPRMAAAGSGRLRQGSSREGEMVIVKRYSREGIRGWTERWIGEGMLALG